MIILGVRVDNLSKEKLVKKAIDFLTESKFHQVATVNPEFILTAQKDEEFKNTLNTCDLNVADGSGLNFAFWTSGEKLKCRMAGADLMNEILEIAHENNLKIFLAANSRGLSSWEETSAAILKKYPDLQIDGASINCHSESRALGIEESTRIRSLDFAQDDKYKIRGFDVVFANFGSPEQEKYLNSLKSVENSKIRLTMGVGGSFDYLTGKVKRAPVFVQKIGLEWFWRLIQQPRRIKRIWNAVIIFPIKVIFHKT